MKSFSINIKYYLLALLILALLFSCSARDMTLIRKVDNFEKGQAAHNMGVKYYDEITANSDFQKIEEVKKYFILALKFDPENSSANVYLNNLNELRPRYVAGKLASAKKYYERVKKSGTTPKYQDQFNTLYFITEAYNVLPEDKEVRALYDETKVMRREIVKQLIAEGNRELKNFDQAAKAKDMLKQDTISAAGRKAFGSALLLTPGTSEAQKGYDVFAAYRNSRFESIVTLINKLVLSKEYTKALNEVKTLEPFVYESSDRLKIKEIQFEIYAAWANDSYIQKRLDETVTRAKSALSFKYDKKISTLKMNAEQALRKERIESNFPKTLATIDSLIKSGEYEKAQNLCTDSLKGVLEGDKRAQLQKRLNEIQAIYELEIEKIYNEGVKAYQAEDFDTAIKLLTQVTKINAGYENSAEYLKKAKESKKLLENF